jgi:hyperosmotically inducible protein
MIRWLAPFALLLLLAPAGCTTVASTAYGSATEERTVSEQASDEKIQLAVRKRISDGVDTKSAVSLDVFSHLGQVVIAGAVPADSPLRQQAPTLARGVEGVKRVDTFWVPTQPSKTDDLEIGVKFKTKVVGDGNLKISQVDYTVLAGQVVLTGVVNSQAKVDAFVKHAKSIDGVKGVRTFVIVRKAP